MTETTDFLVIGGGVIGCAVAYELSKARATAILVERGEIGQEASSAAAGMLSPLLESDGDDGFARLCLQARSLFPDYLEELRERTGVRNRVAPRWLPLHSDVRGRSFPHPTAKPECRPEHSHAQPAGSPGTRAACHMVSGACAVFSRSSSSGQRRLYARARSGRHPRRRRATHARGNRPSSGPRRHRLWSADFTQ